MQRTSRFTAGRVLVAASLSLVVAAACGDRAAEETQDTAAFGRGTVMPAGTDTGMTAGMNRSAPHDSNQVFLRMMSDHHEGLIAISDSAAARAQNAKSDAQRMKEKQEREQQEMMRMLAATHSDSITPVIIPSNRQMLDSTLQASGASVDTVYYRQIVHHHAEGIRMSEPLMPHLTGEVKQMAEKMTADQKREIEEFRRKAGMRQ